MEDRFFDRFLTEDDDSCKNKYLMFKVSEDSYCIATDCIKEIIGMERIIEIPDNPVFVRGIINLRGSIITIIDMRRRLNKETCEHGGNSCIVVLKTEGVSLGIIVDSVIEILEIDGIKKSRKTKNDCDCMQGYTTVKGKRVSVLDCGKLAIVGGSK